MKIKVENGRVVFNGETYNNLNLDLQFGSDEILKKVDNDYSLHEIIEMAKVKANQMGLKIDFVTEKI